MFSLAENQKVWEAIKLNIIAAMPFVIKSLNASVVCCFYCVENTKIPRPLMNRAPLSLLVICFEIWMRSWRGDEGYKDGCWTPIREGLSLVSRQTRGGRGDLRSILVNIQGERRDSGCRSDSTPLWCPSAVMGISREPRDRNAMTVSSQCTLANLVGTRRNI